MQLDWTTDTTWKHVYEPKPGTKSTCVNLDEVGGDGAGSGDGEDEEDDEPPVVRKCLVNLSDC
jgi:hypothetical protein